MKAGKQAPSILRIMFYAGLTLIVVASFMQWGLNTGLAMWGAALVVGAFIESLV